MRHILFLILLSTIHRCDSKPTIPTVPTASPSSSTQQRTPSASHTTQDKTSPTSSPTQGTLTARPTSPVTPTVNIPSSASPTNSTQELEWLIDQLFPRRCGIEEHHLIPSNSHRRRRKRVVNGYEAKKGQFPWQVALLFKNKQYCGGSIVHERYVLTGAHCFNPYTSYNPAHWSVVAGDHRLNNRDMFETRIDVLNITTHENYKSMWFEGITDTPPKNDIAIIKLKYPLHFDTRHIQPICLLRPNITFQWGERCFVSGWGHLEWNGSQPNTLNYARLPLVSYKDCNIEKAYNGTIHETALCAGYPQGQTDACEYDSGGPLSCIKCGQHYLTGIVSWGHKCAMPYKYGVYARMQILTPWLVQKISQDIMLPTTSKK